MEGFISRQDIIVLWHLGVVIAAFFVVLVIHIVKKASRDKTEINLINKVLSLTKTGDCRWSLTEDDHDWTVFACMIDGKRIEFIPSPVCGALSVGGLYPPIELGFREKRNLEKAIKSSKYRKQEAKIGSQRADESTD